jgi:DsbC/DsbD-like thiol-disulfide interchange protein
MSRLFLFILPVVLTLTAVLRAQQSEPVGGRHVTADLLADTSSIQPGQPFTVALRLKMDQHWHTYWLDPGDSGEPISVKWTLPTGFTAGPLQFPVPIQFVQPGDIVGYGYENEVVLLTTITPPGDLPAGTPIDIKANVSWLVCSDVCLPGKAALAMSLPVGLTIAPSPHVKLIDDWRQRVPVTDHARAGVKAIGYGGFGNDAYHVGIEWDSDTVGDVEFFPPPAPRIEFRNVTVTPDGRSSNVRFHAVALGGGPPDFADLKAVVAYTDATGNRRGVVIPLAPLKDFAVEK